MRDFLLAIRIFLLSALPLSAAVAAPPSLEREVLAAVNIERARHEVPPVLPLRELNVLARRHSAYLYRAGTLSHEDERGRDAAERVEAAGLAYSRVGENVAMNQNAANPAEEVVRGWMNSPEHRANILDPQFTHVGTGVHGRDGNYYFTQIFFTPSGAGPR